MERNYIIEGLFILLGLALVFAIIKYPKDALFKLPLGAFYYLLGRPIKYILSIPLMLISIPLIYLGEKFNWRITPKIERILDFGTTEEDDRPHTSTSKIKLNFIDGDKYVFIISTNKNLTEIITDFLEALTGKYTIDNFTINTNGDQKIIRFPKNINFYDFHLFVQHFNGELGGENSFGIYKSKKIQYYVYQDANTINNLVGFTTDKKYFSIYMLDDLEKKQYLKVNQKLNLDTSVVERWMALLPT